MTSSSCIIAVTQLYRRHRGTTRLAEFKNVYQHNKLLVGLTSLFLTSVSSHFDELLSELIGLTKNLRKLTKALIELIELTKTGGGGGVGLWFWIGFGPSIAMARIWLGATSTVRAVVVVAVAAAMITLTAKVLSLERQQHPKHPDAGSSGSIICSDSIACSTCSDSVVGSDSIAGSSRSDSISLWRS